MLSNSLHNKNRAFDLDRIEICSIADCQHVWLITLWINYVQKAVGKMQTHQMFVNRHKCYSLLQTWSGTYLHTGAKDVKCWQPKTWLRCLGSMQSFADKNVWWCLIWQKTTYKEMCNKLCFKQEWKLESNAHFSLSIGRATWLCGTV